MSLNFNVSPYYDDFDPAKNYYRVLFKPGYAVQARELTQSQSILQNQISSFASNIFAANSPVTGGQVTTNLNCYYIKLQPTFNNATINVTEFNGQLIQDATGTVVAKVIASIPASSGTAGVGDPPTLIVTYKSGNQFQNGSLIYAPALNYTAQAQLLNATGSSSVASIAQGVFYISGSYVNSSGETITSGTFVQVNPQTVVLDKYDNVPNLRVGLNITETIADYISDASLLDPAVGASNYQAPGADRYQITLTLETRPLSLGDDDGFIELIRITDGNISKTVDGSVYSVIDDYFSKRDYETNGDYVVNNFKLTPKTNVNDSSNNTYVMSIGKGLAYVRGHRVESTTSVDVVTDRARTTNYLTNNPVYLSYGNYFYVDTVRGANGSFFDTTTQQAIDLHCVPVANVNTSSVLTYNSTLVATANVRALYYDHDTSDAAANTYVYKLFVNNIQTQTVSNNAVAATTNTITLPSQYSAYSNAYVGMSISIISGTDAGDFRTITSYNGSTKVATVNQNWTVTPDTTSVFSLNFATTQTNCIINATKTSFPATINSTANINTATGKDVYGNTILENPGTPELLFQIGNPYVASSNNNSYTSQQEWRGVTFNATGSGVSASLSYAGYSNTIRHFGTPNSTLNSSLVKQNFTIVVTNKGTNSNINVGDVLSFTTTGRTISLDSTGTIATLTATDISAQFTATILETVFVENADNTGYILKNKNLINANTSNVNLNGTLVNNYTFVDNATYNPTPSLSSTGQVYIQHAGLVTPGSKQSLYLSDVKNIVQIIDTGSPSVVPTASMLGSGSPYDVTSNYVLDNGQRDGYYDHAGITLIPGAPQPKGNLLVLVNYYQHTGGDGFFSVQSYLNSSSPEQYQSIPQYTSSHGTLYSLRDCIDFRPARLNAQPNFVFRYSNSATNYGLLLPIDSSIFEGNYSYYLGRQDYLVLTKDRNFKVIEGAPSTNPTLPATPDGSLILASLSLKPYTGYLPSEAPTGYVPDLSITVVPHKRYTMADIGALETRINNMEYYTSLSVLEQNASALQISDAYGLNRFKNGIMVDDFSSYATADTANPDYAVSINKRTNQMTALQNVSNYPLQSLALAYNMGLPSTSTSSALGYNISSDGLVNYFSLPYTTANAIVQQFASRTVNVNPFAFVTEQGTMSLTPNVDNWVDTNQSPALLITDPNLQVFQSSNTVNVLSAGDWQTISGTSYSSSTSVLNHGNPNVHSPYGSVVGYTATTTYSSQTSQQTNILGNYDNIGNTYSLNNGYITDISVLPYIQAQEIIVSAQNMLFGATLEASFDGQNVQNYIRKTNVIELTGVTGSFNVNDIIGYYNSGVFTGTARVVGVQVYPNSTTGQVRLYVASDPYTTTYSATGAVGETIQNAYFDQNGNYQSTTANGKFASQEHFGGRVISTNGTNTIQLSPTASTANGYYVGNTISFCTGDAINTSSTITAYNGLTQTATLSTTMDIEVADVYSIGTLNTDEYGSFYGIFNIPAGVFHTGQRVLQLDNGNNFNSNSWTTYAQATFYAEGLQTTSQALDFGASPAGAKNTFTQVNQQTTTNVVTTYSPYDPVAQTFEVSVDNYPNGLFLNSIKVFFQSKPTDNSPITLSIVGTLNGYPNGATLDHSIVTMTPDQINVSQSPQFLDPTAYTEFEFNAPVYIQPGVLYAFILKSNSDEYNLWTAAAGDVAVLSSVKNLPTDPTPSVVTKIGSAPYVGALFLSQNSQTWTADQNQDLMFVADCCVFNTAVNPTIEFVVPNKLPRRTLIDQSLAYFKNANGVSNTVTTITNSNVLADAFNITTTDFVPSNTEVGYQYNATLASGGMTGFSSITPGKYGTSIPDNIYLNDGQGERVLVANANASFVVTTQISTTDPYVSPIISDAGLSTFVINWNINNASLSNNLVNLISTGSGYSNSNTTVVISAPTGKNGVQATAVANVANGNVTAIYITNGGQGYITTPTITINGSGTGASATITGETSSSGGPALSKYVTKKVVLAPGNDSGDLNVYLTAYRPVNTDINVYYKILNRNDTQTFESGNWQLMTKTNSSDTNYSQTRTDILEYSFAPGTNGTDQGYVSYVSSNGQTYNNFSQFAIKVVLTTTDKTAVPFVTSLQAIALPSNVNTTN